MADEIIAGQDAPFSSGTTLQSNASDILENKVSQLKALLRCCYGDGSQWFEELGMKQRDFIMWIAWDLADDAEILLQRVIQVDRSV